MEEFDNIEEGLIAKYISGELTADERQLFDAWLAQKPINRELLKEYEKANELALEELGRSQAKIEIDVDTEWIKFQNSVKGDSKEDSVRNLEENNESENSWYRIAAVFILLVGFGFALNYYISESKDVIVKTAANQKSIELPDGSHVTLNSNSKLSYAKNFGDIERSVTLKGEAFFDVSRDESRPFVISTESAKIQVLGTSFNVFSRIDKSTEVVVTTGTVKVFDESGRKSVTIGAGERAEVSDNRVVGTVNHDDNYIAWKTRVISFENQSLLVVIEALERIYNVQFNFDSGVISSCEVTATFNGQTIESILNVLESTLDLEYVKDGSQIDIISAGCN